MFEIRKLRSALKAAGVSCLPGTPSLPTLLFHTHPPRAPLRSIWQPPSFISGFNSGITSFLEVVLVSQPALYFPVALSHPPWRGASLPPPLAVTHSKCLWREWKHECPPPARILYALPLFILLTTLCHSASFMVLFQLWKKIGRPTTNKMLSKWRGQAKEQLSCCCIGLKQRSKWQGTEIDEQEERPNLYLALG